MIKLAEHLELLRAIVDLTIDEFMLQRSLSPLFLSPPAWQACMLGRQSRATAQLMSLEDVPAPARDIISKELQLEASSVDSLTGFVGELTYQGHTIISSGKFATSGDVVVVSDHTAAREAHVLPAPVGMEVEEPCFMAGITRHGTRLFYVLKAIKLDGDVQKDHNKAMYESFIDGTKFEGGGPAGVDGALLLVADLSTMPTKLSILVFDTLATWRAALGTASGERPEGLGGAPPMPLANKDDANSPVLGVIDQLKWNLVYQIVNSFPETANRMSRDVEEDRKNKGRALVVSKVMHRIDIISPQDTSQLRDGLREAVSSSVKTKEVVTLG
eukprot:613174-Prymnesium_polylepis.2